MKNTHDEMPLFFTEEDKEMIEKLFSSQELKQTMLNANNKKILQAKFKQTILRYDKAIKKLTALKQKNNDNRIDMAIFKFEREKMFMLNTFGFLFKE